MVDGGNQPHHYGEPAEQYHLPGNRECLTDVFQVSPAPATPAAQRLEAKKQIREGKSILPKIYPTLVSKGTVMTFQAPEKGNWLAEVIDINGRLVYKSAFNGTAYVSSASLPVGVYLIRLQGEKAVVILKFVVTH
jgi:hypothetical protein